MKQFFFHCRFVCASCFFLFHSKFLFSHRKNKTERTQKELNKFSYSLHAMQIERIKEKFRKDEAEKRFYFNLVIFFFWRSQNELSVSFSWSWNRRKFGTFNRNYFSFPFSLHSVFLFRRLWVRMKLKRKKLGHWNKDIYQNEKKNVSDLTVTETWLFQLIDLIINGFSCTSIFKQIIKFTLLL